MLHNLNFNPKSSNIASNDATSAKNIIDILFVFIDGNIRNDTKMTGFTKGLILSQLPGIRSGSKDYINGMNSVSIKKLLDDIEMQLKNRR